MIKKKLLIQDNIFSQIFLSEVRQVQHYLGQYQGTPYDIYQQGSDFWGTIGNQKFELDIDGNTFHGFISENTFSGEINENQAVGLINNFPWAGTFDDHGNFEFTWNGFAIAANTNDYKDQPPSINDNSKTLLETDSLPIPTKTSGGSNGDHWTIKRAGNHFEGNYNDITYSLDIQGNYFRGNLGDDEFSGRFIKNGISGIHNNKRWKINTGQYYWTLTHSGNSYKIPA